MFRRGMRSRLIDWFLLLTVIFTKLYYAKEAWGKLFVGPLGVPTLREAGKPSNCSFWSRDSWKHIGFQLSSAWDAGWQPLVSSFCPRQVCSHNLTERYLGSLGQSTLKQGPRVASEQVLCLHWTDGFLLWSHLCFNPQLGPLQPQFMKQTWYRMHQCQGEEKCSCPPGAWKGWMQPHHSFPPLLNFDGHSDSLLQQGELPGEVCDGTGGGLLGCSPGHSEHGRWSCAARGDSVVSKQHLWGLQQLRLNDVS